MTKIINRTGASMKNSRVIKIIRKKLHSPQDRKTFQLSEVPEEYKPLVKKIMKSSPVWGSHHTIQFPNGYVLKGGRDGSRFDMFDLPLQMESNTVLDIGCNIGAISIECKKRNAKKVIGLDKDKNLLECAIEIAGLLQLDIEYKLFDVSKDEIHEKYDYVFFLNVFHHLKEKVKIKILRNIDEITGRRLVFEGSVKGDIVSDTYLTTDDYLSYLKGFTTFSIIRMAGYSDFNRPVFLCDR